MRILQAAVMAESWAWSEFFATTSSPLRALSLLIVASRSSMDSGAVIIGGDAVTQARSSWVVSMALRPAWALRTWAQVRRALDLSATRLAAWRMVHQRPRP